MRMKIPMVGFLSHQQCLEIRSLGLTFQAARLYKDMDPAAAELLDHVEQANFDFEKWLPEQYLKLQAAVPFDKCRATLLYCTTGGSIPAHIDDSIWPDYDHLCTVTVQLSDAGEYVGGELVFTDDYMISSRAQGDAVFHKGLAHMVLPVIEGHRFTLSVFLLASKTSPTTN